MKREIIYWELDRNEECLYEWLEKHKDNIVSFSVTRFMKGHANMIASVAMAIVEYKETK